jgi:hypothetical protein
MFNTSQFYKIWKRLRRKNNRRPTGFYFLNYKNYGIDSLYFRWTRRHSRECTSVRYTEPARDVEPWIRQDILITSLLQSYFPPSSCPNIGWPGGSLLSARMWTEGRGWFVCTQCTRVLEFDIGYWYYHYRHVPWIFEILLHVKSYKLNSSRSWSLM